MTLWPLVTSEYSEAFQAMAALVDSSTVGPDSGSAICCFNKLVIHWLSAEPPNSRVLHWPSPSQQTLWHSTGGQGRSSKSPIQYAQLLTWKMTYLVTWSNMNNLDKDKTWTVSRRQRLTEKTRLTFHCHQRRQLIIPGRTSMMKMCLLLDMLNCI